MKTFTLNLASKLYCDRGYSLADMLVIAFSIQVYNKFGFLTDVIFIASFVLLNSVICSIVEGQQRLRKQTVNTLVKKDHHA